MAAKSGIPREKTLDNSLALLMDGYLFIANRCNRFQSDIFQTRLMGQKAICVSGEEAAKIFYDTEKFRRRDAVPGRIKKTLFGAGGVQTLDNRAHEHRKNMFMSLMTRKQLENLSEIVKEEWESSSVKWEKQETVVLFDEMQELLLRVACKWAGVPIKEKEVANRAANFGALVDAFGAVGPRHWQGRRARTRLESWMMDVIENVRSRKLDAPENSPLHTIAWHQNLDGKLLNKRVAAVELINILRPIVAIATYITFGALALHHYPETRDKLKSDQTHYTRMFVQEVRRFYPFGPFVGARVNKEFLWADHHFKEGTLVLLDIYGTNHSPKIWGDPEAFRPERFANWEGGLFDFIPQGGGGYDKGHRCAGEWVTIEVMKTTLDYLVRKLRYDVPEQNLSFSMVRMPSIPKSRFMIKNAHRKQ